MGTKDIPADRWERRVEAKISAAAEKEKQRKKAATAVQQGDPIGSALHGWAKKLLVLEPPTPKGFSRNEQQNLSRFMGESLSKKATDAWNELLDFDNRLMVDATYRINAEGEKINREYRADPMRHRNMRQPNLGDLETLSIMLGDKVRETYPGLRPKLLDSLKTILPEDTDK
tara:strand:- start:1998 stop:2513 length:516 start_codon:yes stop_codon:yes gene_type:complete